MTGSYPLSLSLSLSPSLSLSLLKWLISTIKGGEGGENDKHSLSSCRWWCWKRRLLVHNSVCSCYNFRELFRGSMSAMKERGHSLARFVHYTPVSQQQNSKCSPHCSATSSVTNMTINVWLMASIMLSVALSRPCNGTIKNYSPSCFTSPVAFFFFGFVLRTFWVIGFSWRWLKNYVFDSSGLNRAAMPRTQPHLLGACLAAPYCRRWCTTQFAPRTACRWSAGEGGL